jgi:hypothetical protein
MEAFSMCKSIRSVLCGLVVLVLPLIAARAADDPTKKEERLAKDAAIRFFEALNAKRLDDLMKIADVPWWSGEAELVKDRDELRKLLKAVVEQMGDRKLPTKATQVLTYAQVRKKIDDPKTRAILDKLLDQNGRWVDFGKDGNGPGVFVRVRQGKARVVGSGR